jgi:hypothetical protein
LLPQAGAGSLLPQAGAGSFVPQAGDANHSLAVITISSFEKIFQLFITAFIITHLFSFDKRVTKNF